MRAPHRNMPAQTLAWLSRSLDDLARTGARSPTQEWQALRDELQGRTSRVISITQWSSDYWIAKSQRAVHGARLTGLWRLPERIDQWSTLELEELAAGGLPTGVPTNGGALVELLRPADRPPVSADGDPARRFINLAASAENLDDPATISANQVRTWLDTALGGLIRPAVLTPLDDDATGSLIAEAVLDRLTMVGEPGLADGRTDVADFGCETLYATSMTADGPRRKTVRQGQTTDWQHGWAWLTAPQHAVEMTATLDLVSELLASAPLLAGLNMGARSPDEAVRRRALCVTRRWLLTTKALVWLSEALRHPWTDVRPQDLACFAFAAVSPAWPRRTLAVSHRSADAKQMLGSLQMWNTPHVAIDANYIPAWETNVGMIWSLFAAVPTLVRVHSDSYLESEWCRREFEIIDFLVEHADFLDGRTVLDLDVADIGALDQELFEPINVQVDDDSAVALAGPRRRLPAPAHEFPPFSMVLVAAVCSPFDVMLLRAGAALRLVHALVRDARAANELAALAAAGEDLGLVPPTNNPDGWSAYGEVFCDLRDAVADIGATVNDGWAAGDLLGIPDDYGEEQLALDRRLAQQIPDLRDGRHRLADVLAALEWQRTVYLTFTDEDLYGDKVIVDVTRLSQDEWVTDDAASIGRGLLAMTTLTPTWILQRAGQDAHTWPGFRQQPIFTRYHDDQFSWLKPVHVDRVWLIHYLANSGLVAGQALQASIIAAIGRIDGTIPLQFEEQAGGGAVLQVPTPQEFFVIPTASLKDVAGLGDDFESGW